MLVRKHSGELNIIAKSDMVKADAAVRESKLLLLPSKQFAKLNVDTTVMPDTRTAGLDFHFVSMRHQQQDIRLNCHKEHTPVDKLQRVTRGSLRSKAPRRYRSIH